GAEPFHQGGGVYPGGAGGFGQGPGPGRVGQPLSDGVQQLVVGVHTGSSHGVSKSRLPNSGKAVSEQRSDATCRGAPVRAPDEPPMPSIGLPVSRTSRTAPSRKSASNFLRVSAIAILL